MGNSKLHISAESLKVWFQTIVESHNRVMAPAANAKGIEFTVVKTFDSVEMPYIQTVQSPKNVLFPRVEPILKYGIEGKTVTMEDIQHQDYPSTVVWAVHPCDVAGFEQLKGVFLSDSIDAQFAGRYEKLTVVGLSCASCDESCFCTSVELQPNQSKGSDILLTALKSGNYQVEIITEKGQRLVDLNTSLFSEMLDNDELMVAYVPVKFNLETLKQNLQNGFDHPYWDKSALRCTGCGTCAFVCPNCSCFDIQDEKRGSHGYRLRCWDSCAFGLFTLHTSGHNPREGQSHRWRQRVMHKFTYIPQTRQQLGCTGCGRCSRACPTDMNMTEHLVNVTNWNPIV